MTHVMANQMATGALQSVLRLPPVMRSPLLDMRRDLVSPHCWLCRDETQLVQSRLDAVLEGEKTVHSALIEIIDTYRTNFIESAQLPGTFISGEQIWGERAKQLLRRNDSRDPDFFSSPYWRDDVSIFREKRCFGRPTAFITDDVRRGVNAALGLNKYDIADGKLIMSFLLFIAQQCGWNVRFYAGPSSQDDYFAMFAQRVRPIIVGPARANIHGQMVHPIVALYHDLFHLVEIVRSYPFTPEGSAEHHEQIVLYRGVKRVLAALGMEDVEGLRYSNRLGFSLLSLLCEGAGLHDDRIPWGDTQYQVLSALQVKAVQTNQYAA